MVSPIRRSCAALLLGAITACSPVIRNHGYVPPQSELAELQVGSATQDQVVDLVGQPSAEGVLGDRSWYYVQSRFRHFGYRAPVEIDREVLALSFAESGVLRNVERFGLRDRRVVPLSRRVTGGQVENVGFLRQLFGNIGNFNAADFLDED